MKHNQSLHKVLLGLGTLIILMGLGCKKRDLGELENPSFPSTAEVFIDDFTGDLAYAAFGGSDVKAFQVDNQVAYGNTRQSMRFEVPDANSPNGSYAGGVFFSKVGRDLSGYNAITFYIKATQAATIGTIGFGNDLGENKYVVTKNGLPVTSNWKKVIIPIPDPSKLKSEKGLFYYSTGPENGRGYTFWIDEVRFEKLGDLGNLTGYLYNGENKVINNAETGDIYNIDGFKVSVNLPTGVNDEVSASPYYFAFTTTASSVATVSERGVITVGANGTTTIAAKLGGKDAIGSFKITSIGPPRLPTTAAPTPTRDPANVVSLYSNAYTNQTVNTWNTRWQFSTAENFFIQIAGNDAIRYRSLNFVGIEFANPTTNISGMAFMHLDLWTPDATALPNNFKIKLIDFGANNVFNGANSDDREAELTITSPTLVSNNWVGIDIPLSSFVAAGLTTRANLAQMVFSGTIPNVVVDNIYFYRNSVVPTSAAPVPTRAAADVLSIFSDSYTNRAGTDFFPNWNQSTVVTQVPVAGNNTLRYANFNYQGTQLAAPDLNVSSYQFLHIDYYTSNASALNAFLICPVGSAGGTAPWEKSYTLPVPTNGWNSVDIPLSHFGPIVDLSRVFQFKFDGGGGSDIYLDNIYFWRIPPVPPTAAPVPTYPAADVIAVYSGSYTNVAGTDLFPFWNQSTQFAEVAIGGNNAIRYSNFNYQGIQIGSNQNLTGYQFLHLDYYTANATALNVWLISPGPQEKAYALPVPTTAGWNSVDIPLTHFNPPVALNNVFQLKFDGGNGAQTFYLDNILFRR
jgi:hypothetical protein